MTKKEMCVLVGVRNIYSITRLGEGCGLEWAVSRLFSPAEMDVYEGVARRAKAHFGGRPQMARAIGCGSIRRDRSLFSDEVVIALARHLGVHPSALGDVAQSSAFFEGAKVAVSLPKNSREQGILAKKAFDLVYEKTGPTNLAKIMGLPRQLVIASRLYATLSRERTERLAASLYMPVALLLRGEVPPLVLGALPPPVPRGRRAHAAKAAERATGAAAREIAASVAASPEIATAVTEAVLRSAAAIGS